MANSRCRAPRRSGCLRGGDFELTCGQDFALGYNGYDGASVEFYLEESITFRVLQPEAAVAFMYSG
jgi:uncharacterized linocin/CFP29 family protein